MRVFRTALAVTLTTAVFGLTGCGGDDGPSQADRDKAEDFCGSHGVYATSGMHLDRYANPDGFASCVDDVSSVVDCLDVSAAAPSPWVPRDCDHDGYNP